LDVRGLGVHEIRDTHDGTNQDRVLRGLALAEDRAFRPIPRDATLFHLFDGLSHANCARGIHSAPGFGPRQA
ncbi:hypothetical protein, partial [Klebsiella pneumoniae]|uniref:hypothetical protein n=1 Tax=Klebsiella pneumoniae TaxID=573 RepID=UPI001D0EAA9E